MLPAGGSVRDHAASCIAPSRFPPAVARQLPRLVPLPHQPGTGPARSSAADRSRSNFAGSAQFASIHSHRR